MSLCKWSVYYVAFCSLPVSCRGFPWLSNAPTTLSLWLFPPGLNAYNVPHLVLVNLPPTPLPLQSVCSNCGFQSASPGAFWFGLESRFWDCWTSTYLLLHEGLTHPTTWGLSKLKNPSKKKPVSQVSCNHSWRNVLFLYNLQSIQSQCTPKQV